MVIAGAVSASWSVGAGVAPCQRGAAGASAPLAARQDGRDDATLRCWPAAEREARQAFERTLIDAPKADSLRAWHDLLGSEPHVAGTPGDLRVVAKIADSFREMGLEVHEQEIWAYLCKPVSSVLQVVSPVSVDLVVKEDILAEDPYTANPELAPGWNAYSGNGDVTAEIVYANYGTKDDFAKLAQLGVDVKGKIVLARYGGNFRGYKAKFAEAAGAAGLIIYTDPIDSGYCKGLMYPEGGFANATCIQRGSILTLDYIGDPLTPFVEATRDAARLDPASLKLPTIPVQPVGWASAQQIIGRMKGAPVPSGWTGGLPFPYRLTGGPELKVRMKVEQERALTKTYNVTGTLRGERWPDEMMIVGCHHDAWGYGAADPLAGTIVLMESARALSDAAKRGVRPARSIVFAAWGAEEYGIVGSTEWVEANQPHLFKHAIGYINLDMASMGVEFGSAATPSVQEVTLDVARLVPTARTGGTTVFDEWLSRSKDPIDPSRPKFGDLGGGSDHAAFVCHVGVAAASIGSGGSQGTSYHSTYDTLQWYRQVVGDDYAPALMNTRMTTLIASRLADGPVVPLSFELTARDLQRHLRTTTARAVELGLTGAPKSGVLDGLTKLDERAALLELLARQTRAKLSAAMDGSTTATGAALDLAKINQALIDLDRAWVLDRGLAGRPWFRNFFVSTDEDSGYASWVLPGLRKAIESRDMVSLAREADVYQRVVDQLVDRLNRLHADLP